MGGNDWWGAQRIAHFILEFVRLPGEPILTSLDNDFGAGLCHDSKQPVAVERTEWLETTVSRAE